ncbi:MAG: arginine--tRNA ligase [Candidatus Pacebacteria bacterium]|nr:arginine--tRNA ligase [Candidatus Paceibacterota bacterium]
MIKQKIKKDLKKAIEKTLSDLHRSDLWKLKDVYLEHPENIEYGDYSSNFAMVKFKQAKNCKLKPKNSLELAEKIVKNFPKTDYLEKIEIVNPGFINFYLKNEIFQNHLKEILKQKEKYGEKNIGKGKIIIIDYSSPNIAKPFSVGHLRSTIIGQALYNTYKFLDYKIIGDNHIGDWGTQFGKLIYAIKKWSDPKRLSLMTVQDLVNLYIRFHKKAEKDPSLNEQGRLWFRKLEQGNKEAQKIWQKCIDISWKEFNRIYDLLDIKIDYAFGESFYKNKMSSVIKQAKKLDITKKSRGALIIEINNKMPPVLILKSDGATTYHTRDLATIKFRQKKFGPVYQMIYETGIDHELHFQQLFSVVQKFDWGKKVKYTHIGHGMIRLPTGKMQTRKGKIVLLENILKKAIKKAEKIVQEKNPNLKNKEKQEIAKIVGIGAVKYNDLSQHYSKNIVFNWDKMLSLKGNSAPYLQYTYARACSILKKGGYSEQNCHSDPEQSEGEESRGIVKNPGDSSGSALRMTKELTLLKALYIFPEIIQESAEKYSPNIICNYLFELSQIFNNFYESVPVLKAKNKEIKKTRLSIVKATAQVIKNGLNLLGISAPKKM